MTARGWRQIIARRGQLEMLSEPTFGPAAGAESDDVYVSVMFLRRTQHSVYRAGVRKHLIDGRQVSTIALIRIAQAEYDRNGRPRFKGLNGRWMASAARLVDSPRSFGMIG